MPAAMGTSWSNRRPPGGAARPLANALRWTTPGALSRTWGAPSGEARGTPASALRGCASGLETGTQPPHVTWATHAKSPTLELTYLRTLHPTSNPRPNVRATLESIPRPPSPVQAAVETAMGPLALEADRRSAVARPQRLAIPHFILLTLEPLTIKGVIGWTLATTVVPNGVIMSERPLVLHGCIATTVMTLHAFARRTGLSFTCVVAALATVGPAAGSAPAAVVPLTMKPLVSLTLAFNLELVSLGLTPRTVAGSEPPALPWRLLCPPVRGRAVAP